MKNKLKETIIYILAITLILIMGTAIGGTAIGALRNKIKLYEDRLDKIDSVYQKELNETIETYEKMLKVCE